MRSTTRAIPTAVPSTSPPTSGWRIWERAAASTARTRCAFARRSSTSPKRRSSSSACGSAWIIRSPRAATTPTQRVRRADTATHACCDCAASARPERATRRPMYTVREIFYTLQGEGANAGRAAVFCRFAGCNLWTGREADRARAICDFCDTDFVGVGPDGGKFATPEALAGAVAAKWPAAHGAPFVVCTGGEPLLQLDEPAIDALHARGFEVAVETNGTQ